MARLLTIILNVGLVTSAALAGGGSPPICPEGVTVDLWPPNHAYHQLDLNMLAGVTDPDGDRVKILITSITQDEPINGTGDGNTSCDGTGVDSALAQIRAERSGSGDGRVYQINYTASDNVDGECQGTITVRVPHDQSGDPAIDSGQDFDSTECFPPADLNASGTVNAQDLVLVLSHWGEQQWSDGDADLNGVVDGFDLVTVLAHWGDSSLQH